MIRSAYFDRYYEALSLTPTTTKLMGGYVVVNKPVLFTMLLS